MSLKPSSDSQDNSPTHQGLSLRRSIPVGSLLRQVDTVAKTLGSKHLHGATLDQPLDFFVMLTSTETFWTPPRQAAYIAANNLTPYFARYCRRRGLSASTVSYDSSATWIPTTAPPRMVPRTCTLAISRTPWPNTRPSPHSNPLSMLFQGLGWWGWPPVASYAVTASIHRAGGKTSRNVMHRWHRDGGVSLLIRAMADARRKIVDGGAGGDREANPASGTAKLRRAFDETIKNGSDGHDIAISLVTEGISQPIAKMIFIDPRNANQGKSVAENDVNSLIAAELVTCTRWG